MRLALWTLVLFLLAPPAAQAQTETPASFSNGFASLASALGDEVGSPLSPEFLNPDNGDTLQVTTTGLNYWSDSLWPTWTNGWRHVALSPSGTVEWLGEEINPPPPALHTAGFTGPGVGISIFGSPREYMLGSYPNLARRIECIVQIESGWDPRGWNPIAWGRWSEHASGLGGFLPSTWRSTPQASRSIWDGFAQIDAIAWMLGAGRGREFAGVAWGRC